MTVQTHSPTVSTPFGAVLMGRSVLGGLLLIVSLQTEVCVQLVPSSALLGGWAHGKELIQASPFQYRCLSGRNSTTVSAFHLSQTPSFASFAGPSHDSNTTGRMPFETARSPAVLRLAGDAFYVNAVDSAADPQSTPQWTVYSDELWSIFHGGVSPNLLSFKASFRLRRSGLLASIHVPQAQDVHVAFAYKTDGAWQSADVSLTLVHSNLRVLCPQVVNGTREFSTRTFPTNLHELRRLEVSVALLGTYCPVERTM